MQNLTHIQLPQAYSRPSPLNLPGQLREAIPSDLFDYQTLMHALRAYVSPRDKVSDLLKQGIIIRVKKGLYLFGAPYRRRAVSRELLANLVYGPSYISLDYALQYHGFIPEAVETITSVTTGRSKSFSTPAGSFTYRSISRRAFALGMDQVNLENAPPFLMATPEKALADKLVAERGITCRSIPGMREYLESDLRIPGHELRRLRPDRLEQIAAAYRSRRVTILARLVREEQAHQRREEQDQKRTGRDH